MMGKLHGKTNPLQIDQGVRQDSIMSPKLFITLREYAIKMLDQKGKIQNLTVCVS